MLERIKAKKIVVTRGKKGALILSKNKNIIECPAFAFNVKDKIGAGDSMQSILSILLKSNVEEDLSIFIASIAASISLNVIANSEYINKNNILKTLSHLMM